MVQFGTDGDEEGLPSISQKFVFRKPVCPYVSSTPVDFQVEREYLAREIFPKLHNVCRERGTSFSPVDIQWAPNEVETGTGHLLRIQLDLITKCSPFFICLLGETYGPFRPPELEKLPSTLRNLPEGAGWLDQNYLVAADSGYTWVLKEVHQNCSMPELEIIQAAFLNDNRHCHFYYRQPEHLQHIFPGLSDKDLENSSECRIYRPENEYADLNIRDLKQRIVNKGLPVKYFETKEQLGEMVYGDWLNIIDMLYPPLLEGFNDIETEEFREWIAHEVFSESRRHVFLDYPELLALEDELSNFCLSVLDEPLLEAEEPSHKYRAYSVYNMLRKPSEISVKTKGLMVVKGDRGTGKSTLIANWVRSFAWDNPEVKVVCHYVGSSGRSRDVTTFMRQAIGELRAEFLKEDIDDSPDVELVSQDFKKLCGSFHAAMSLGPCVLIIDGVDELGATLGIIPQEIKTFSWMPLPLPAQCRVIVTTTTSDYSHTCLAKRPDATSLILPSLNTTKLKTEFLEEHMSMHFSHLNRATLQTIHDTKLSGRPLFLTGLGTEMSAFSVFMELDTYVETIREICTSIRDLYLRSLRRWSHDHSWTYEVLSPEQLESDSADFIGWVPDVLRLIAVSRSGLSANELLEILETIGYQENVMVTSFDWLMLKVCLGEHLTEGPGGVFNFSHQQMREMVEYTLLKSVKPSTSEIISKSEQDKEWKQQKQEFHQHLAKYFSQMPKCQRRAEELPWQQLMAGDVKALKKSVTSPEMFLMLVDPSGKNPSNHYDLKLYWHYLQQEGFDATQLYIQLLRKVGILPSEQQQEIQSVDDSEYGEEFEEMADVIESGLAIKPSDIQIPLFTPSMPNVPMIYATPASDHTMSIIDEFSDNQSKSGDVGKKSIGQAEMALSTESVSTAQSDDPSVCDLSPSQLSQLTWHIADFLRELGPVSITETILLVLNDRLTKGYPLLEEDQLMHARAQERLGELYLEQGDNSSAEKWYKKSLRTVMDMFDTDEQSPIYPILQTLKAKVIMQIGVLRMDECLLDDADDLLQEALETAEIARNIPIRATILYHLGLLRQKQCEYLMAETNLRNSIFLRERWYGKRHPSVAESLIKLGHLMADANNDKGYDLNAAQGSFRRALNIREHHFHKDHVLVADTLFELGKVLKCDSSYATKTECNRLLRRALDIRITQLGGEHIDTRAVRQYLSNLEVTLRASKQDQRSSERPFSSLSWRGTDIVNMERKSRLQSGKSSQYGQSSRPLSQTSRTGSYMSRPTSRSMSRPVSGQVDQLISSRGSILSASEKLMFETSKPRLLHRGAMERRLKNTSFPTSTQIVSPQVSPSGELGMDDSRKHVSLEAGAGMDNETAEYGHPDGLLDSYGQDNDVSGVKFANKENRGPRPSSRKSPVHKPREGENEIGWETPPQRLYRQYASPHDGESALKIVRKSSSVKHKRPVWSARSTGSSLYTSTSYPASQSAMSLASTKSHKSSCDIPAGPHSIHISNARTTTMGFHSGIKSLLGPQGPKDLSIGVHHKSAWYHVPGRYSTMDTKYAPKRSQKRPEVKKLQKSRAPIEADPYQTFMNSEYRTNNPSNTSAMLSGKRWHTCKKNQGQPLNYYQRSKQYVVCENCQSDAEALTLSAKGELERLQEENEESGTPFLTPTVNSIVPPDRPTQVGLVLNEPIAHEVEFVYAHPGTVVKFQQDAVVMN